MRFPFLRPWRERPSRIEPNLIQEGDYSVDPRRKENVRRRLSRIEGQVRGLARMVEEDKYCVDIMIQVAAAKSALNSVGLIVMEGHAHGCLVDAIKSNGGEQAVNELMDVISQFVK